jgi:hypothetical protein
MGRQALAYQRALDAAAASVTDLEQAMTESFGPAVLEVLLDPRMLAEQVEHDPAGVRADRGAVDGGAEYTRGVAADAAAEDDPDIGGAADAGVVGDQGLEERPGPAGASNTRVRDTSTWRIEISHQ